MPRVWNKRDPNTPKNAKYVGRPTKYGNPFVIGKDGDRNSVIQKYLRFLDKNEDLRAAAKDELKGEDLVCYCAPDGGLEADDKLVCHGQVLLRVANEE